MNGEAGEPGEVLQEREGTSSSYRFAGDELYVRARVVSSKMQEHPAAGEEAPEYAWTQPVIPGRN